MSSILSEHLILRGIVGSRAYGLDHAGSDTDRLGVFVLPTECFWRLEPAVETWRSSGEDETWHEFGKAMRLFLAVNPTLTELLWLPEDLLEVCAPVGEELRRERRRFLCAKRVHDSYGRYAMSQLRRLQRRHAEGKEGFSSDTRKRTAKHARHLFRLLEQGRRLLATGELQVRVDDPASYERFDGAGVEDITAMFNEELVRFELVESRLPDQPDSAWVEAYIERVRRASLS